VDIQYIQFNDTLVLTSVAEVPDFNPRSLKLTGPDFTTAVEVDLNEQTAPSFVVANPHTIIVQVPDSLITQNIRSVLVVSSNYSFNKQSVVTFRLGPEPRKISGIKVLMQMFMKIFFTSPNYDSFSKGLGGSALEVVGGNTSTPTGSSVVTTVARAVSTASDQVRALQSRKSGIPDDERLLAANLLACQFNPGITGVDARVELVSQAGTAAVANLTVD
jgi:hypothetical protein